MGFFRGLFEMWSGTPTGNKLLVVTKQYVDRVVENQPEATLITIPEGEVKVPGASWKLWLNQFLLVLGLHLPTESRGAVEENRLGSGERHRTQ